MYGAGFRDPAIRHLAVNLLARGHLSGNVSPLSDRLLKSASRSRSSRFDSCYVKRIYAPQSTDKMTVAGKVNLLDLTIDRESLQDFRASGHRVKII